MIKVRKKLEASVLLIFLQFLLSAEYDDVRETNVGQCFLEITGICRIKFCRLCKLFSNNEV